MSAMRQIGLLGILYGVSGVFRAAQTMRGGPSSRAGADHQLACCGKAGAAASNRIASAPVVLIVVLIVFLAIAAHSFVVREWRDVAQSGGTLGAGPELKAALQSLWRSAI